MIILLDGSKGAGKTTVGEILVQHLKDTVFLSLDVERRALKDQDRPRSERNKEAFTNVMTKSGQYLDKGSNLIIDCGLIEERIARIDALAAEKGTHVYKFLLKASYETQLERVRSRDSAKGNETDVARFAEVHGIVHAKDFDGFTIIDTDQLSPEQVADEILKAVR
jgi:predicted kinase